MEFTEAESNMHDLVLPQFNVSHIKRLPNTNNIKMRLSTKKKNTMRSNLSKRVQSKLVPRTLGRRICKFNLHSVWSMSLFSLNFSFRS